MRVSVVIPTLNEADGIGPTIDAIPRKDMAARGWQVEVLVVDGNSRDATRDIAEAKGAKVLVEERRGYGRAYKTGFNRATGDVIVTGDADGTYPFEMIPELVERLHDQGLDFITTNRFAELEEGAMSAKHKLGNWVLSATAQVLFGTGFKDSQSGMWVFKKDVLERLVVESDEMAFSEEIKVEAFRKAKAREVPIPYRPRLGDAKIETWRHGLDNWGYLFRMRFRR